MPFNARRKLFIVLFAFLLTAVSASAQERTVGVLVNTEDAYDGYALFSPVFTPNVYLIDSDGQVIHAWQIENSEGIVEAHLRENGNLVIVTNPRDEIDTSLIPLPNLSSFFGSVREYTWDNEFVWEYQFVGADIRQHHGIDIMPNGNILAVGWNYHSLDEAIETGLNEQFRYTVFRDSPPFLLPDIIMEIDPTTDETVWQWNPWDHLIQEFNADLPNYGDVSQRPERIDINYQPYFLKGISPPNDLDHGNWMHANMVNYNPELDQIVLSVRAFDEFWIIDHSASTAEAAGPAGDLLWRWGNPATYGQGDLTQDRQLFHQHDVQWIEPGLLGAGNILLFNNQNGFGTDEEYSSVLEVKPPLQADGTYDWEQKAEIVWSYTADGFHSRAVSGAQRLPNGNTLITEGMHGRLFEVSADGEVVWEFVNPETRNGLIEQGEIPNLTAELFRDRNILFRVRKYPVDYPGFAGRDMTPGDRLID